MGVDGIVRVLAEHKQELRDRFGVREVGVLVLREKLIILLQFYRLKKMHRMHLKLTGMILFLLAVFSIPHVNARNDVFVIGPMQEAIETIELKVSKSMHADVCGNMSVIDGFVDFYVIGPSGNTIICYNKTSFSWFSFSVIENGTYTMHLANTKTENNVTAKLNYGVNFEVVFQETIHPTWHTVATWQTTIDTPSLSLDILEIFIKILSGIITFGSLAALGEKMLKFFRGFYWIKKYRKSRTPVVFKLIGHISHKIIKLIN